MPQSLPWLNSEQDLRCRNTDARVCLKYANVLNLPQRTQRMSDCQDRRVSIHRNVQKYVCLSMKTLTFCHSHHFLPSKAQRMKISVRRWQMMTTKMKMLAATSAAWTAGPTPDERPTSRGRVNANPSGPNARPGSGREGGGGAPPRKRRKKARKKWASVCGRGCAWS